MKDSFETIAPTPWASPCDTKAVKGMRKTADRRPDRRNRYWMLQTPTLDTLHHRRFARILNLEADRRRARFDVRGHIYRKPVTL